MTHSPRPPISERRDSPHHIAARVVAGVPVEPPELRALAVYTLGRLPLAKRAALEAAVRPPRPGGHHR